MKLNLVAGLILGLASNLALYGFHAAGLLRRPAAETILPLVLFLVQAAVIVIALARQRARAAPQAIPFSRLLGAGLIISLFGGVLIAAGAWVFIHHVDPSFLDWLVEQSRQRLATLELDAAQRQQYLEQIEALTPAAFAAQRLMPTLIIGFLISLVASALLRLRLLRTAR